MKNNPNPIQAAIAANKRKQQTIAPEPAIDSTEVEAPTPPEQPQSQQKRKRGRPATGKRSDEAWIGRTFYVKEETDLDVEMILLSLKRQGIKVDKSELVEKLLAAWVKWHQGENIEIQLDEISPIQKDAIL